MLKKCANPLCPNAFRVLSQGKLFQMEVDDFVACANRKNRSPPRGALLALRPMLLLTHPNFRKRTRNDDGALPSPKTPLTTVALGTMRAAPQSHAVRRSP